ncbi:hypothetical protein BSLG_006572 [Batrachochytrium salamandrivorans]|nr:hypothetical protein BSLG_006572 [Batrachochytrium salamandrivorans]
MDIADSIDIVGTAESSIIASFEPLLPTSSSSPSLPSSSSASPAMSSTSSFAAPEIQVQMQAQQEAQPESDSTASNTSYGPSAPSTLPLPPSSLQAIRLERAASLHSVSEGPASAVSADPAISPSSKSEFSSSSISSPSSTFSQSSFSPPAIRSHYVLPTIPLTGKTTGLYFHPSTLLHIQRLPAGHPLQRQQHLQLEQSLSSVHWPGDKQSHRHNRHHTHGKHESSSSRPAGPFSHTDHHSSFSSPYLHNDPLVTTAENFREIGLDNGTQNKDVSMGQAGGSSDNFLDMHPETPARVADSFKAIRDAGLLPFCYRIPSRSAERSELELVHTGVHLDNTARIAGLTDSQMDRLEDRYEDTYLCKMTPAAAGFSCGGAIAACEAVWTNQVTNSFALVRPPGHHAEAHRPMGFCFYNNVAVAARRMKSEFNVRRIMIVDWDVHHGNGTQAEFYDDPNVLFISLHRFEDGQFYPSYRVAGPEWIGGKHARGRNINIAWPCPGMGDADYMHAFHELIMPIGHEFNPDMVIVSAGFDAAHGDQLESAMSRLPGGYHVPIVKTSVVACMSVLIGAPPNPLTPSAPSKEALETICELKLYLEHHWKCIKSSLTQVDGNVVFFSFLILLILGISAKYADTTKLDELVVYTESATDAMQLNSDAGDAPPLRRKPSRVWQKETGLVPLESPDDVKAFATPSYYNATGFLFVIMHTVISKRGRPLLESNAMKEFVCGFIKHGHALIDIELHLDESIINGDLQTKADAIRSISPEAISILTKQTLSSNSLFFIGIDIPVAAIEACIEASPALQCSLRHVVLAGQFPSYAVQDHFKVFLVRYCDVMIPARSPLGEAVSHGGDVGLPTPKLFSWGSTGPLLNGIFLKFYRHMYSFIASALTRKCLLRIRRCIANGTAPHGRIPIDSTVEMVQYIPSSKGRSNSSTRSSKRKGAAVSSRSTSDDLQNGRDESTKKRKKEGTDDLINNRRPLRGDAVSIAAIAIDKIDSQDEVFQPKSNETHTAGTPYIQLKGLSRSGPSINLPIRPLRPSSVLPRFPSTTSSANANHEQMTVSLPNQKDMPLPIGVSSPENINMASNHLGSSSALHSQTHDLSPRSSTGNSTKSNLSRNAEKSQSQHVAEFFSSRSKTWQGNSPRKAPQVGGSSVHPIALDAHVEEPTSMHSLEKTTAFPKGTDVSSLPKSSEKAVTSASGLRSSVVLSKTPPTIISIDDDGIGEAVDIENAKPINSKSSFIRQVTPVTRLSPQNRGNVFNQNSVSDKFLSTNEAVDVFGRSTLGSPPGYPSKSFGLFGQNRSFLPNSSAIEEATEPADRTTPDHIYSTEKSTDALDSSVSSSDHSNADTIPYSSGKETSVLLLDSDDSLNGLDPLDIHRASLPNSTNGVEDMNVDRSIISCPISISLSQISSLQPHLLSQSQLVEQPVSVPTTSIQVDSLELTASGTVGVLEEDDIEKWLDMHPAEPSSTVPEYVG